MEDADSRLSLFVTCYRPILARTHTLSAFFDLLGSHLRKRSMREVLRTSLNVGGTEKIWQTKARVNGA